jgi:PAS domain S-box-containing protein
MAKRILVVDDSPIELKLTARVLGQAGYEVSTATSGAQALALARENPPDLVLLDLNMPQMDGYEVCRRLKEDEATRAVPVVLYSVRDQIVDVLRGLEVGAEDFIVKGTRRDELLARVHRILRREREIPPLDLSALDEALTCPEAEPIARLLEDTFYRHVRPCLNALFGVHPALLLIECARRQAAERARLLLPEQGASDAALFDPRRVRHASTAEVLDAFKAFASELLLVTAKLANTRIYGPREMDEVLRAFKTLLHTFSEHLHAWRSPSPGGTKAHPSQLEPSGGPLLTDAPTAFTFLLDAEGRLQNLDEDLAKALGYERAELLGVSLASLLPDAEHEALQVLLRDVRTQGKVEGKLMLRRRDGTLLPIALSSHALFDRQGNLVLSQHQAKRLSETSEWTEQLRRLQHERDRLREELQRARAEYETFLHIISHDLRQPLQIILNAAQLLEEESGTQLDDSAREYLTAIERAALRLREMIGDLLKLAHITPEALRREPTDVGRLLEEIRETVSPLLEERNAWLTLTGPWPIILADAAQLRLVFLELIQNALTFNDKPRPLIEIGCAPTADPEHTFYVRDNGIGIEARHWERIFHVFQRVHSEEEFPGRGVGLALCKRIIEAHGGRIWVESTPGVGSTFSLTLPAANLPKESLALSELSEGGGIHSERARETPLSRG